MIEEDRMEFMWRGSDVLGKAYCVKGSRFNSGEKNKGSVRVSQPLKKFTSERTWFQFLHFGQSEPRGFIGS